MGRWWSGILATLVLSWAALPFSGFAQPANQTIGNLSIRGQVGPNEQLISGFVIEGVTSTPILIRGIGPALAQFGVTNSLRKPALILYNARGEVVAQNAGWSTRPTEEHDNLRRGQGAFRLAENSADSGFYLTLEPGAYTVHLSDVAGSSGIGLLELYHGSGYGNVPQDATHLVNISSRCVVGEGEAVGIAGMSLPMNRRLLIRVIGPALAQFGVTGVLPNPRLEIVRPEIVTRLHGGVSRLPAIAVTSNDDWNSQLPLKLGANPDGTQRPIFGVSWRGSPDEIREAARQAGAFPLAEGAMDAAMLVNVDYSPMTVQVTDSSGGSGVALIEIYDVSD